MDKKKKQRVRRVIIMGIVAMIVSLYIGNEFQDRNGKSYAPAKYFETGRIDFVLKVLCFITPTIVEEYT